MNEVDRLIIETEDMIDRYEQYILVSDNEINKQMFSDMLPKLKEQLYKLRRKKLKIVNNSIDNGFSI